LVISIACSSVKFRSEYEATPTFSPPNGSRSCFVTAANPSEGIAPPAIAADPPGKLFEG
jgi:hypothetical protein